MTGSLKDASERLFQPARKVRAFEEIIDQIRTELATGQYRPGQRLASEKELCKQFQVSRNTVREALRALESAGILETRKGSNGGTFVANTTSNTLVSALSDMRNIGTSNPAELFQARIWVEQAAIRVAVKNVTGEEIRQMEENIRRGAEATARGDFEESVRINIDFHRLIAQCTGNRAMITLTDALLKATHELIRKLGPYDNSYVAPARRRFLKRFAAGDADGAIQQMERQLKHMQLLYAGKLEAGARPQPD